jgi:serine/threonine protein kinase
MARSSKKTAKNTGRDVRSSKKSTKGKSGKLGAPKASPTIQMGDVLDGRWRVRRKLGEGGMGAVYEAEHVRNGRKAAIKVMLPEVAADPLMREMFEREGRLDNEVDEAVHVPMPSGPGAVKVFDSGTLESGAPYMVMEMLKGRSLGSVDTLPPGETAKVMDDTLAVLEGAHKHGILHRDIKPDNLWVTPEGDVKVLDFGLARKKGARDFPKGSVVGTPGYMPPEQISPSFGDIGPETDVYAVGATGFRLLTGTPPTAGTWPSCPPPIRSVNPNVKPHIADVIDKMLACAPTDRYPTAMAARDDLERAMIEEQLQGLVS